MTAADIVAWWGAILSTALAFLTVYDRFLAKPVPTTTYNLTGWEQEGNDVIIINATETPLMLGIWRLYWAKPRGLALVVTELVAEADFEAPISTIEPHSTHNLHFAGDDHFTWGINTVDKGQLYLELQMMDLSKPVVLHVYNPDKRREPRSLRRLVPHALRPLPERPLRAGEE